MIDNTLELTNGQIIEIAESLAEIAKKELPVKISYWLGRIATKIDVPYRSIMDIRDKLIIKNSGGERIINPDHENWEKFLSENDELMNIVNKLDFSPVNIPVEIPEKVNGKDVAISLNTLVVLDKLIKVEGLDFSEILPDESNDSHYLE